MVKRIPTLDEFINESKTSNILTPSHELIIAIENKKLKGISCRKNKQADGNLNYDLMKDGAKIATMMLNQFDEWKIYADDLVSIEQLESLIKERLNEREFSEKQREKDADKGYALPDGSFPIENTKDLKNAIHAVGRAKDYDKAKAHIKSRAKAIGAEDLLPESW
jgi:hypothetical protein